MVCKYNRMKICLGGIYNKNIMLKYFRGDWMYQKCSICGTYSDDGTIRDGKLICHECLDKKEEGA